MQETRRDGSEQLTERPSMKQVKRALKNPENLTVALHKPGAVFETHDGMRRRFRVRADGALERLKIDGSDEPWQPTFVPE